MSNSLKSFVVGNIIMTVFVELIIIFSGPSQYKILFLAPLFHCVLSILFSDVYIKCTQNIIILICVLGYFLKLVVIPVLDCCFENVSVLDDYNIIETTLLPSVCLFSYEMIFVFLVIKNHMKRSQNNWLHIKKDQVIDYSKVKISFGSLLIISGLLIIALILLYLFPDLSSYFIKIGISTDEVIMRYSISQNTRLSMGYLYWIATVIFDLLNYILPGILFIFIMNVFKKKWVQNFIAILLAFFLCNFVSDQAYISYISALTILVLLYFNNKKVIKKHKVIFTLIMVFGAFFVIYMISTKNSGIEITYASLVNAYFPAYNNLGFSLLIDNKIALFINDILKSIPLVKGFFTALPSGLSDFDELVSGYSNVQGQIIPMIGQGRMYFGFIFAPILSAIVMKASLVVNETFYRTNSFWLKYYALILAVSGVITIFMYNFSTFISMFCYICPFYFIFKTTEKKNGYK